MRECVINQLEIDQKAGRNEMRFEMCFGCFLVRFSISRTQDGGIKNLQDEHSEAIGKSRKEAAGQKPAPRRKSQMSSSGAPLRKRWIPAQG